MLDAKIPDLPSYLRIEFVKLEFNDYDCDRDCLNDEEFQQFMPLLHQLRPALVGSQLIIDTNKVIDPELDSFLKEKLLPFFDCCVRYNFSFKCNPKEISAFLASLLQLPSIGSSVGIEFVGKHRPKEGSSPDNAASLPIEAISNWLHKLPAAAESIKKIGKKRYFRFHFSDIENMSEMVEHLKKVGLICLLKKKHVF